MRYYLNNLRERGLERGLEMVQDQPGGVFPVQATQRVVQFPRIDLRIVHLLRGEILGNVIVFQTNDGTSCLNGDKFLLERNHVRCTSTTPPSTMERKTNYVRCTSMVEDSCTSRGGKNSWRSSVHIAVGLLSVDHDCDPELWRKTQS